MSITYLSSVLPRKRFISSRFKFNLFHVNFIYIIFQFSRISIFRGHRKPATTENVTNLSMPKFYEISLVTRFRETNSTMRSVSSSKILEKLKSATCTIVANYHFPLLRKKFQIYPSFIYLYTREQLGFGPIDLPKQMGK